MVEKQQKFITDKRDISQIYGNKDSTNKKQVKNPKYDSVKSTVDTGKSIKNVVMQSDQLVSKRKSELFKRVKGGAIIKLFSEIKIQESIYNLGGNNEEKEIKVSKLFFQNIQDDVQSIVQNINNINLNNNDINSKENKGKGTLSIKSETVTHITSSSQIVGDLSKIIKFIIIDLREPEEFASFHIKEAISMPYYNVSREKYPSEMFLIKNHMDKMIIAYGYDERNSIPHCQLIFQKGYDNIYMLSGGIEEFVKSYPDYCEGPGMAEILIQQQKIIKIEQEQLSKQRYKNNNLNNNKEKSVISKDSLGGNNFSTKNNLISSKTSVVSNQTNQSEKTNLSNLKKNLGVNK